MKRLFIVCCLLLFINGCDNKQKNGTADTGTSVTVSSDQTGGDKKPAKEDQYFQALFQKIITGTAKMDDVKAALTDTDPASLTNTMHALYSMRWHRGVTHMLMDMWNLDKTDYPDISWDLIEKPPVRLALASTINRIQSSGTREFIDYLRAHEDEKHEFNIAQVAIGLGFQGDPADVEYLKKLASGDNHYVIQSSLTALSLMHNPAARDALEDIVLKFRDDPRSNLAVELLKQAYHIDTKVRKTTTEEPDQTPSEQNKN